MAGDQEMALTPMAWAGKVSISDEPSSGEVERERREFQRERRAVKSNSRSTRRHCISVSIQTRITTPPPVKHSLLNFKTEIFPSLEAHAKIGPNSNGAQEIELTVGRAGGVGRGRKGEEKVGWESEE